MPHQVCQVLPWTVPGHPYIMPLELAWPSMGPPWMDALPTSLCQSICGCHRYYAHLCMDHPQMGKLPTPLCQIGKVSIYGWSRITVASTDTLIEEDGQRCPSMEDP